jgi:hypothetical protein
MNIRHRSRSDNLASLPLFRWADARDRHHRLSYPAAWIRKRWPDLPPATAATIAELHFEGPR